MFCFFNRVKELIEEELEGGIIHFVLYPFGERGVDIKKVLNDYLRIQKDMIIDNLLAKTNGGKYRALFIAEIKKYGFK